MAKHRKNKEEEILEELENEEVAAEDAEADEQEEASDETSDFQAEIDKLRDMYMRSQAEMENLRKRTQIELEKRSKYAVSSFAKDLLTVSDNLTRAMEAIPESERENQSDLIKNLLVGLDLTQKDLQNAFEKNDIKPVESVGHIFDPNVHKVIQEIEDPSKPAGTIVQEWQKGYTIGGDRVLREAMVIVTKGGPRSGEKPQEPGHKIDTSA